MTPADLKVRGENAARLLGDKMLIESLDTIEREIIEQWEACPTRDTEGRELLWNYYKTAKKFRAILAGVVQEGRMIQLREVKQDPNVGAPKPFFRR